MYKLKASETNSEAFKTIKNYLQSGFTLGAIIIAIIAFAISKGINRKTQALSAANKE